MKSKLPPRTSDEEKGIEMLHEYLDQADYQEGAEWTSTPEEAGLMDLGMKRFCQEEFEE